MPESIAAVVAGHLCLDITPDLSNVNADRFMAVLRPGRLIEVGRAALSPGGTVSNTGRALQILGIPTVLMGKVGDDPLGQVLRQVLAADEGTIVDPDSQTSYTVVLAPPGMDRIFLHCPGANDTFGPDDVRYDLVAQARLFHFGYPPIMRRMFADGGGELADLLRRARATGATISLDLALPDPGSPAGQAPWQAILGAALPHVDVFLPSVEEILYMLRREAYHGLRAAAPDGDILPLLTPELLGDLSAQLLDMGPQVVGFKLGRQGFYLRTGSAAGLAAMGRGAPADPAAWAGHELWAPIFQACEVTATGAGDSAYAGFLAALLRGLGPEQALSVGCAVGACNVEAADTVSGLRDWDATLARLAAGWPQSPLAIDAPGWCWDETARMWRRDQGAVV